MGHVGVGGVGYSCRGIHIQLFMSDSNSKNETAIGPHVYQKGAPHMPLSP